MLEQKEYFHQEAGACLRRCQVPNLILMVPWPVLAVWSELVLFQGPVISCWFH